MTEGIMAVDQHGSITQTNEMVWKLLGLDKRHQQASTEDILQIGDLRPSLELVLRHGQVMDLTLQVNHRLIFCQISPIEEAYGFNAGAVALFRDITETERLEQTRKDYVANV